MDSRLSLALLFGVFLGVILGVEVIGLADERACPQTICLEGAEVVPLSDRGFFPAVHERLMAAESSIYIASFEFKYYPDYPDSKQNILVEDLMDAKKRGVDVRLVLDEYSTENNAAETLLENGIPVRYDGREVTTHAKLVVIDGEVVVLGSTNFSYYGLEKNNEVALLVFSEEVAGYFHEYFMELWG